MSTKRIAIVLPGLHRVLRGAEIAFESIARELAWLDGNQVTLFGSGKARDGARYHFVRVNNVPRERFESWPHLPVLRSEYSYEELTFLPGLFRYYRPENFDLTVTCSYPLINWFLRARGNRSRPAHIFVTQNGDYPVWANRREYRYFGCDGLVCTNLEYWERNHHQWCSVLIPNGVDPKTFSPGQAKRDLLALPAEVPIVLMVSALIPSKHVVEGIQAVAKLGKVHLVVCGDGPERETVQRLGAQLMPGRFHWKQLPRDRMPELYRAANLLLHLSRDEPFGNVYLEALATGLPIVTHKRQVTEWLLEDTAVLVDTTDEAQVITGIAEALGQGSLEAVTKRRALVEQRFTWSAIGRMYNQFFQAVLQQRSVKQTQ